MQNRVIHSVGIDIGTTTTQMIFSRLKLTNRAPISRVPHYEFSERAIIFVSPITLTPIDEEGKVDEVLLAQFIEAQYQAAGFDKQQIESGAIIITGETSKTKNARHAIMELAKTLGDFVVATAGAHLESVIAGKGSGACEYSKNQNARVLNIDIGGGTSNYAVFEAGRVVDTACLNVGGHLVQTDEQGHVKKIHPPAKALCQALWPNMGEPIIRDSSQLYALVQTMADLVIEVIQGTPSAKAKILLMTESLRQHPRFDAVFISGGVGKCFYRPQKGQDVFAFKDIGCLLANALHQHPKIHDLAIQEPKQTVHATVIGAGAHTLSLSGSTVWISAKSLPICNVPVLHPLIAWADVTAQGLAQAWQLCVKQADLMLDSDIFALVLPNDLPIHYGDVKIAVEALKNFSEKQNRCTLPLIVVAEQDIGKILGMELQPLLRDRELAIIDEVKTQSGDYIDIGQPFFSGSAIPLTIKSLAFPS